MFEVRLAEKEISWVKCEMDMDFSDAVAMNFHPDSIFVRRQAI